MLSRMGVRDPWDIEDVTQEVYRVVKLRLREFDLSRATPKHRKDRRQALLAWLVRGIARKEALMYLRTHDKRTARETLVAHDDELEWPRVPHHPADHAPPDAEAQLVEDARRQALYKALATLPADSRALVSMLEDEVSIADIAQELGITEDAVRKRAKKVHKDLQAAVDRLDRQERERARLAAVGPVSLAVLLEADQHFPPVPESVRKRIADGVDRAITEAARRASPSPELLRRLGPVAYVVPHVPAGLTGAAIVGALWFFWPQKVAEPMVTVLHDVSACPSAPAGGVAQAQANLAGEAVPIINAPAAGAASVAASAAEDDLLDHARLALASENLSVAFAALAEHAQRFPKGRRAAERERLWTSACATVEHDTTGVAPRFCSGRR